MKLTEEYIESQIERTEAVKVGQKTTVVVLTLKNGFEVIGTSACIDPAEYNMEVGTTYARKRAVEKVWELEGYLAQTTKQTIFEQK